MMYFALALGLLVHVCYAHDTTNWYAEADPNALWDDPDYKPFATCLDAESCYTDLDWFEEYVQQSHPMLNDAFIMQFLRDMVKDAAHANHDEHFLTTNVDEKWCANQSAWEWVPVQVAQLSVSSDHLFSQSTSWNTSCWGNVTGTLTYNSQDNTAEVQVVAEDPYNIEDSCQDQYVFLNFFSNHHVTLSYKSPSATYHITDVNAIMLQDIKDNGLYVVLFPCGLQGTFTSIYNTLNMFNGTVTQVQDKNIQFLHDRGLLDPVERFDTVQTVNEDLIRSGSLITVTGYDGMSAIIQFGTGGHTAHSAMLVWDGPILYVVESTDPGVRRMKYKEWITLEQSRYRSMAILTLKKEHSIAFNHTAYWKWFHSVEGLQYGYHNFFFSFLDTSPQYSLPLPIHEGNFLFLIDGLNNILPNVTGSPASTYYLMIYALNHRLNSSCVTLDCIYEVLLSKDMTLSDGVAIPENDLWKYGNYSMICSAMFSHGWRVALPHVFTQHFSATEQTPKDNVMLKMFEENYWNSKNCPIGLGQSNNGNTTFCQLMGAVKLQLYDINSIEPYLNMNDHCGAQWPMRKLMPLPPRLRPPRSRPRHALPKSKRRCKRQRLHSTRLWNT